MICPRCHTTDLDEKDRQGVKIDVCPSCRGVWLDRGELEKLIAHATADVAPGRVDVAPGRRDDGRRDDDDDRDEHRRHRYHDDDDDDRYRGSRRRSWWADIFD
jgi:hypothetical protein